jgi:hypothetical protein
MTLKDKFKEIEDLGIYSYNGYPVWNTVILNDQSPRCVEIADEFAIGFAEWITQAELPLEELLEIYKKEKGL